MDSKKYFDEVAEQWDEIRQGFFGENVGKKALNEAGVQAGELAADIGAGSGFITELLLKNGLTVYAVDQSAEMIKRLQSKFGETARFVGRQGESGDLPIADNRMDYVFANMYLHHVENPAEAILEMVRILKPGGKLIITDLDEHNFEFLVTEHHDLWMVFKRNDLRKWFEQARLSDVKVGSLEERCCSDSACGCESAEISIFIASGKKGSNEIQHDDIDSKATAGKLKDIVKTKYGEIAKQNVRSCGCEPDCCSPDQKEGSIAENYSQMAGYNPAADLGLGCGLPVRYAEIKPGDIVVDLGSGAGNDVFVARSRAGDTGYVYGVDLTSEMIEKANRNLERAGFLNVEFKLSDIENLPFENETADVVISNCVINLVPDKSRVFREIYRILKPGGRIAISDIVTKGDLPENIRNSPQWYTSCIGGAIQQTEYLQIIESAGFKNITIETSRTVNLSSLPGNSGLENNSVRSVTVTAHKE